MLSFIMGIIAFLTNTKKKIDNNSIRYKERRNEAQKRINEQLNGGKESEKDKEQREQENNPKEKNQLVEKSKALATTGLVAVLAFIETLPLFISAITWSLILIVLMIVVIIIFSFMEALKALLGLENDCAKPTTTDNNSGETSGGGVSAGGLLAWTNEELSAKGAKLTPHEQNIYRMGILANEMLSGKYGFKGMYGDSGELSDFVTFSIGLTSIESSMVFYDGKEKNIMKNPIDNHINGQNFGFMGLKIFDKLTDYMNTTSANKIKSAYKPSSQPQYTNGYAPYAVAMSVGHQKQKYNGFVNPRKSQINARIAKWGFKGEELKRVKSMVNMALVQGAYLSWQDAYLSAVDYMIGIYIVSGDSSDTRSLSNYGFTYKGYDESTLRYSWTGGRGYLPTSVKKNFMTLNGKPLGTDVTTYALKHIPSNYKSIFESAVKTYTYYLQGAGKGSPAKGQFFYYGLNSIVIGATIESTLAKKMKITAKSTTASINKAQQPQTMKSQPSITMVSNPVDKTQPGGIWVIANKNKLLPSTFVPDLVIPDVYTGKPKDNIKTTKETATALEKMFTDAERAGTPLAAFSGYRSYKTQQETFAKHVRQQGSKAKALKISAPAGASEHQTGLTMDVVDKKHGASDSSIVLTEAFGETKAGKWIAKNAYKYGFIIRYPKGKTSITTYDYEPWHIRYVGKELAKTLTEKNLTMEEAQEQGLLGNKAVSQGKTLTKDSQITIIGDSIVAGVKDTLQKDFPNAQINAQVGLQMTEAEPTLKDYVENKNVGDGLVIALGTNGTFKKEVLQKYVDMVPKTTPILLVNTYHKKDWMKEVNKTIASVAKANDNVTLVDWASQAKKEYLSSDGVHPNAKGQKAYIAYLEKTILATNVLKDETKAQTKSSDSSSTDNNCNDNKNQKDNSADTTTDVAEPTPGNFKETPGKGQARTTSGKTTEQLMKAAGVDGTYKHWIKEFGKSSHLEGKSASSKVYKDKIWGVPFYGQGVKFNEPYAAFNWTKGTGYGSATSRDGVTVWDTGCMIFAHAYVMSALTGKLINPAEMFVILKLNGNIGPYGLTNRGAMTPMYAKYGLKSKLLSSYTSPKDKGAIIKAVQSKKLVVVRADKRPYAIGNHFFVITGYEKTKGKEYFILYTSAWLDQSVSKQPADAVMNALHLQSVIVSK